MGELTLIIEVSESSVKAGAFPNSGPGKYATATLTAPEKKSNKKPTDLSALAAALRSIKSSFSGFETFDKVYLSIPPSRMSLRALTLPFKEKKKIDSLLPFELSGTLPMEAEEAIFESILLGSTTGGDNARVLAVAIDNGVLNRYIEVLREAGLEPAWVGGALFSIPGLLKDLYGAADVTAYISKGYITVSRGGEPLFFNSIHDMESLKLNLDYMAAESIKPTTVYWEGPPSKKLKSLFPDTTVHEELKLPEESGAPGGCGGLFAIAEDIRKGLTPGGINLRKGKFAYTKERAAFKRRIARSVALAVVILGIFAGDLYLRYMGKAGELGAYRESLRSSYLELFPNERGSAVTDELYLLKTKLAELNRTSALVGGGSSALDILASLTHAGAALATEIRLHEANIGGSRITARGTAVSFEAANEYKEALIREAVFTDILVTDVKSKAGGAGVAFSLTITVKDT